MALFGSDGSPCESLLLQSGAEGEVQQGDRLKTDL
jgi:hypothetical protein